MNLYELKYCYFLVFKSANFTELILKYKLSFYLVILYKYLITHGIHLLPLFQHLIIVNN